MIEIILNNNDFLLITEFIHHTLNLKSAKQSLKKNFNFSKTVQSVIVDDVDKSKDKCINFIIL